MGKRNKLARHAAIGVGVAAALLSAFWIGAPSSHGERSAPAGRHAEDTSVIKAILAYETITPAAGSDRAQNRYATTDLTVRRGDTLMGLLVGADIARPEAYAAITALSKVFKPRDLMPGQRIAVTYKTTSDGPALQQINFSTDPRQDIRVRRDGKNGFSAHTIERTLTVRPTHAGGVIRSSLYLAGQRAEVPPSVLADLIRIFSFDVDFQRDVQPGDSFDLMYERQYDKSGAPVAEGDILNAEMVLSGKRIRLYRFRTADGDVDYYDENGHSVRKALILTPIDGARISSGYGRRRHPILGYTRMHRGIDFAAPRGTPIYAAGRGTVEVAGRNGGYGNYIRIRHNGTYKTAYGHLKAFARGVSRGRHVRQGQVIGYVGSTGRSTGPHLHYEVLRNGHQVNPKKLNLPSGRKLAGADLKRFLAARETLENRYAALPVATQVVESCGAC